MTKAQILAELKGAPSPRVEQVGPYWQIGFAWVSGARKDGIGLARDLMAKYRNEGGLFNGEPVPVEIPASLKEPEAPDPRLDLQAARITELEAELDAAREKVKAAESAPPADLADLIDWTAPPKERQEALLVKLREVAGMIGLAEDRGGRAPAELYARRDRLESGIHFNRPTLTETI